MKKSIALAFLLVLVIATVSLAQDRQPVTLVSNFHVDYGKEGEFLKVMEDFETALFAELMEKDLVLAWGIGSPFLHQPGTASHSLWWTCPSMAEMDQVVAAMEGYEKKYFEENPEVIGKMLEIIDLSKHYDSIYRDLAYGHGTPPPAGSKPYTWIFTAKIEPGHEDEYVKLWKKYSQPLLDKMIEDGSISAYGLSIQEVRTTDKFTHFMWMTIPDFASYEKARSTYLASFKERSEAENKELRDTYLNIADPEASRSFIIREHIFHAK
jgi:hypothetical protein